LRGGEVRSHIRWGIWQFVLAVLLVWGAFLARHALLIVYVSGLLAIGFSPIVRLIERQTFLPIGSKRFPRWLAILVLYLFILGVIFLVGFLIFPPVVHQAQALWTQLPEMFEKAQQFLIDKGILSQRLTLREAVQHAPAGSGDAVGAVAGALANVAGGLFGILTILILTFYVLVEADRLRSLWLRLFPRDRRAQAAQASREVTIKLSAWLGGQLLLSAIIGTTSAIGLWAIGIPFFYVLAVISAIGELIPVVGPILSAIPAIAIAATISLEKMLVVVIFFVVQQQFENHVLVPKVMSRQVGVSAVTVIVSLLIGGELLGILGAILAVPTVAILQVIGEKVMEEGD
jgi:predicted PurR-regulated permease PerM